jgi:hypothetical protein
VSALVRAWLKRARQLVVEWVTPLFIGLGVGSGGAAAVDQATDGVKDRPCCESPPQPTQHHAPDASESQ